MTKILDWKKYTEIARRVVAEGCVLLENKDNINDLKQNVRSSLDLNYKILSKLNCIFE